MRGISTQLFQAACRRTFARIDGVDDDAEDDDDDDELSISYGTLTVIVSDDDDSKSTYISDPYIGDEEGRMIGARRVVERSVGVDVEPNVMS
jgi:hypothetical protein